MQNFPIQTQFLVTFQISARQIKSMPVSNIFGSKMNADYMGKLFKTDDFLVLYTKKNCSECDARKQLLRPIAERLFPNIRTVVVNCDDAECSAQVRFWKLPQIFYRFRNGTLARFAGPTEYKDIEQFCAEQRALPFQEINGIQDADRTQPSLVLLMPKRELSAVVYEAAQKKLKAARVYVIKRSNAKIARKELRE